MTDEPKDLEIVLSDQVKAKMEEDPELADILREVFANMRQAAYAVQTGQYESFDDAMEAITGQRPQRCEEEDED